MICLNATTDSNDSAISYSSMSLPSSPIRSSSIQQLLESPIIKSNPQKISTQNIEKCVELEAKQEVNDESDDIIVAESPETTPVGSQETDQKISADLPLEVANSQTSDDEINNTNSETNSQNNCRNSLRRQTSVCVSNVGPFNTSITSSPRAMAILKNARIKSGFNSNKISDKTPDSTSEDVIKNTNNIAVNGVNSPPNSKFFRNSPLSRGSVLLKAAKERMEKQEIERSPKINYNQVLNESNYDNRRLTGILRKHELTSSPTSGEPKAKKKKVLFAEPVVSSELEFQKTLPFSTLSCFEPMELLPQTKTDKEVEEITLKQNRVLVHQNSTFEKEFDSDSQQSSDSPLLFTDDSEEVVIPSCGQPPNEITDDEQNQELINSQTLISSDEDSTPDLVERQAMDSSQKVITGVLDAISPESIEDLFMCSQVMPETTRRSIPEDSVNSQDIAVQTQEDDPIIMVPFRLSQIKDLYKLFGSLVETYSDP